MGKSAGRIVGDVMTGGLAEPLYFGPQDAARQQAEAAQGAATAQQRQAQAAYNETAGIVNPASVAALTSLDQDIARQSNNLKRQEDLISQLDPTVIEASQQALKLMRGEQSATLAPIRAQRDQQRVKLLNSLREQLGPGAETSTAGIQALTRFDSETNQLMAGQQQNALTQMGNISSQFNSQRPDMFREIMGMSQLGQSKFGVESQRASMLGNARMGLQQTAGAQFTGQMIEGQQKQAMYNNLTQLGMTGAGMMLGGGLGGAAGSKLGQTSFGDQMGGQQTVGGIAPKGGFNLGNNYNF